MHKINNCSGSPLHSDVDFSSSWVEGVEPALHEKGPLQTEGGNQEVEANGAKAVFFQERHEETEANEDHDVDVLEAWRDGELNVKQSIDGRQDASGCIHTKVSCICQN